jgi:hypothetical protein
MRADAAELKKQGVFKDVWRSKGFFWIASKKSQFWNWS